MVAAHAAGRIVLSECLQPGNEPQVVHLAIGAGYLRLERLVVAGRR